MKISIASDHAGFALKSKIIQALAGKGHDLIDLGTHSEAAVDYPDYALKVGQSLAEKKSERGIMICGSGVGACIACNKVLGIRAAICHDSYSAHQGVEHDDMNVLVLGARIIGEAPAQEIVEAFLKARFSKEERHQRRLDKVLAVEALYFK